MRPYRPLRGIDDEVSVAPIGEDGRPVIPEAWGIAKFERVGYELYGAGFDPFEPDYGFRHDRIEREVQRRLLRSKKGRRNNGKATRRLRGNRKDKVAINAV